MNKFEKLTVAVELNYRGMVVSNQDENLEVVYYNESLSERDYWTFEMGNITRALIPFKLRSFSSITIPHDIDTFLQDWENARFVQCNILLERSSSQKRTIPISFMHHLANLRDFLKMRKARMMLAGGILLGWYRECSLIPHTTDIDFFIPAEDYSPVIRDDLEAKTSPYHLFRIYGTPTDSYELSIRIKKAKRVNIDLFFLYTDANESYVGGLAWHSRAKYKWTYPRITSICTADLLGYLFSVPCNTKEILDTEYGDWLKDSHSSKFVWYKSHRNVHANGFFSKAEMVDMRVS